MSTRTRLAAAGPALAWCTLAALAPQPSTAATTRVSYLAGGSVYVEAGSLEGLAVGDTLEVTRAGTSIARLRVAYCTAHRATCDTLSTTAPVAVGDPVAFAPRPAPPPPAAGTVDSARSAGPTPADRGRGLARSAARRAPGWLKGRVGLRYLGVQSRGASSGGYSQPALDLRLTGDDGGGHFDFAADVRGRRTARELADGSRSTEAATRIYRLSATVHDAGSRRRLTLGRQSAAALTAISLFDGALAEVGNGRFGAGIFSGVQPAPGELGFSSEVIEHGAFLEWHQPPLAARRWNLTAGGVTSSQAGLANRDFLFTQASWSSGSAWLWGFQEVDLNRGWKRALGEPALSFTNTLVHARAQLAPALTLSGGFDNRRNVRLYRDRATPETEFDDRYRQGGWGGVTLALPAHLRLDASVRAAGGVPRDRALTWTANAEAARLTRGNGVLRARVSRFGSETVESDLASLAVGLEPLPQARIEISGGLRTTRDRLGGTEQRARWEQIELDIALARRCFLTGSFDRTHGDLEDTLQEYVGLSWRF